MGTMSSELGSLEKLTKLWLYNNQLTGTIPSELSNIADLDTSGNHLLPFDTTAVDTLDQSTLESTILTTFVETYAMSYLASTPKPTLSREELIKEDIEVNVLLRGAKFSKLPNNDRRNLALDWLLHDDPMKLDALGLNLWQRFILALLAFGFGELFMSSDDVDWLSGKDECVWYGVSCSEEGEMITLNLKSKHCEGTLPPEISKLEALSELWLFDNRLTGTIPSELGNLGELTRLSLAANLLTGTIPSELGNLRKLTVFSLSYNDLTGTIPSELGDLGQLERLYLSHNLLTGTVPSELSEVIRES